MAADAEHIQMSDSGAYQRSSAMRTNVGQRYRRQTSSAYECRTAAHTNGVLQCVRTEYGDVGGRQAVRTNVDSGAYQ